MYLVDIKVREGIIIFIILNFFFRLDQRGRITTTKARFIAWKGKYNCTGFYRHNICVFGTANVPDLIKREEYFINKLMLEFDPIAYQCMEEWFNRRIESNKVVNFFKYCVKPNVAPYTNTSACLKHFKMKKKK
jgi:hypothetical protein